ncbi:uncharacterized protein [Watersipora subatra]|uniref:uncharacterized protein n=1 Tax=Watersipora subatra TaxID=2589382 RepID=UPI00355BBEE3
MAQSAIQKSVKKRPRTAPVTSSKFVDWSMEKQKKKYAAISIQRIVKGWLDRRRIQNLKNRAMSKHGTNWKAFCSEYKALLARIQRRCGEPKPSCPVTYKDIENFMVKKEKYEGVFDEMKDDDQTLARKQILPFFRNCGLFPLEKEVSSAFRAVFKGCSVQSDVVFLLDCSRSIGSAVYGMQLSLIKDIIGHCEVSYDRIRVAVIPYNDDVFRVIDFDSYGSKDELLTELGKLTYETVGSYGQITRTDIALRCMTELIKKANTVNDHIRDGAQVPKICFAFTDGKCYHTQLTNRWSEFAKDSLNVTMFAVTCSDEEIDQRYLLDIASAEDKVLKLSEYKTLGTIKSAIQGQMCLSNCPLCHYAQKSSKNGMICSDERRGLFKHEVLELIWMVYCPSATGLKKYRDSLWMAPQVEGTESIKLSRYHPVGTDYRTCLRKAVEERIEKTGKVILPTETGVRVREISDANIAMDFIDQLCVSKLSSLGLVERVGLNVTVPAKYA